MSSHAGDTNDVIYDSEGARVSQYGWTQGLIWVQMRAHMGSPERAVMGLESRAFVKHVICSKTCNNFL